MKKLLHWALVVLLFAATACDKEDGNDDETLTPGEYDLATGVPFGNRELILADRNVGATEIGGEGSYLTAAEALSACPKGYHLLTQGEALALISDSRYNTSEKFISAFRIPNTQYLEQDDHIKASVRAAEKPTFLHIENNALGLDGDWILFNPVPAAVKLNLRCVKGTSKRVPTVVSGSFRIGNNTTFAPKYIYIMPESFKGKLAKYYIFLSIEPWIGDSDPEESLNFGFAANPETGKYTLSEATYETATSSLDLLPSDGSTATFTLDLQKQTAAISAADALVEGGVQGAFTLVFAD